MAWELSGFFKVDQVLIFLFLYAGPYLNLQYERGLTPFYTAALKENLEMCKLLLPEGAVVEVREFPLNFASLHVSVTKGNQNAAELLFHSNACVLAEGILARIHPNNLTEICVVDDPEVSQSSSCWKLTRQPRLGQ